MDPASVQLLQCLEPLNFLQAARMVRPVQLQLVQCLHPKAWQHLARSQLQTARMVRPAPLQLVQCLNPKAWRHLSRSQGEERSAMSLVLQHWWRHSASLLMLEVFL